MLNALGHLQGSSLLRALTPDEIVKLQDGVIAILKTQSNNTAFKQSSKHALLYRAVQAFPKAVPESLNKEIVWKTKLEAYTKTPPPSGPSSAVAA